jgi:hypothetical protein
MHTNVSEEHTASILALKMAFRAQDEGSMSAASQYEASWWANEICRLRLKATWIYFI